MILRIVKLAIAEEHHQAFWDLFNRKKKLISQFEGCIKVDAYADAQLKYIFTVSEWEDSAFLEHYRKSEFFKETWTATKKLFYDRPEAWSLVKK